jgi:hypothetical protein
LPAAPLAPLKASHKLIGMVQNSSDRHFALLTGEQKRTS